jgi:hypothetical protein
MKERKIPGFPLLCSLMALAVGGSLAAMFPPVTSAQTTVPVSMIVSAEPKEGRQVPEVHREDVRVFAGNNQLQLTDWVPLRGDQAGLELFVLVDDASDTDISLQYGDLRQFMDAQPPATSIAVGYMRYGTVGTVQNFTKDHALAGKALRLPTGTSPSPYIAVSELIKRWPESSSRREILLISSGIDRWYGGPGNPYLEATIRQAQRAGIQIYAIYAAAFGHYGHSFWRFTWGQNNLSELTDATGGEFYYDGFQTPVAFKPFLDQMATRLLRQYKVTFLAVPGDKASYQRVRFQTEVTNAELLAADKVFVPAAH